MNPDIESIAQGLTEHMRCALSWPKMEPDGRVRINYNTLYPPTITGLEVRGLVDK